MPDRHQTDNEIRTLIDFVQGIQIIGIVWRSNIVAALKELLSYRRKYGRL